MVLQKAMLFRVNFLIQNNPLLVVAKAVDNDYLKPILSV